MQQRPLGRTGAQVGVVGLGTWQLGADWGDVSEDDAFAVLAAAVDAGVTFFDTADVYGDGRSEQLHRAIRGRPAGPDLTVATKIGRRAIRSSREQFTPQNFRAWIDRSRRNLGVDTLDLVQLHCPPTAGLLRHARLRLPRQLVDEQAIAAYGVSVETVAEALTAIARAPAWQLSRSS